MSGGVDSAVAAKLLVEAGYEVLGVTLKLWEPEGEVKNRRWQERTCCKVGLAKFVSSRLKIEHQVFDVKEAFQKEVIEPFCNEYMAGRTPNPCIICNEKIKFRLLAEIADKQDAYFIATGHYVKLVYTDELHSKKKLFIKKADDTLKDQSYFLYRLSPDILPRLLFPLGSMKKNDVWKLSESVGLPPDEVKESQEICFVTEQNYRGFLKKRLGDKNPEGYFVDSNGKILGKHTGVSDYTVGQRKGLAVAAGERLYVVNIDPASNQILLGGEKDLLISSLHAENLNLFSHDLERVDSKVRYSATTFEASGNLSSRNNEYHMELSFTRPQRSITPGQSVVLYKNDLLLGGGIIKHTFR